jgi:Concanavalin A-like lectin/glucanases superfamily
MAAPYSQLSCVFGGTDEFVTMEDVLDFDTTDTFSVSCWFKGTIDGGYIVSKMENSGSYTGWALASDGGTGGIQLFLVNDHITSFIVVGTNTSYSDGVWHHACATWDGNATPGAGGVTIYVDGVAVSVTMHTNTLGTNSISNSSDLALGARAGAGAFFIGSVDEVAIYDKELSGAEVTAIHNSGSPLDLNALSTAVNLVGWWRMGDGDTYPTLTDHSTASNDGTMTNMESSDIVEDVPPPAQSVDLDGSNEFITMGNVLDFATTATRTISVWFKSTNTVNGYVISKRDSSGVRVGWSLMLLSTGAVTFIAKNSDSFYLYVESTSGWNDGAWHQVVITLDGTGGAAGTAIYLDGHPSAMTVHNDTLGTNSITTTAPFNFSGINDGGAEEFDGKISEASLWDVEMAAGSVRDLYNAGNPPYLLGLFSRDPIGYWRISGSDYPDVVDLSSGGNDGVMTNTESTDVVRDSPLVIVDDGPTPPYSQLSCVFGGTDEYVTMGDVLDFDRTDTFSVVMWFKTTATTGYLVSKRGAGPAVLGWGLFVNGSGQLEIELCKDYATLTQIDVNTTTSWNDGTWHCAVITWDGDSSPGAAGLKIYVDGVSRILNTTTDGLGSNSFSNSSDFNFGGRTSGSVLLVGSLDETAIYDVELTSGNVTDIYNGGAPPDLLQLNTSGDLVGWWRMGDGDTFPTLTDHSSGGNDGTMTNMEATDIQADVPTRKFSLVFGGTDEYVAVGDVLNFERTDAFSFSLWFKMTSAQDAYILTKHSGATTYTGYNFGSQAATTVFWRITNNYATNSINLSTVSSGWNDDEWHHAVCTYDGSSTAAGAHIYIDGVDQTLTVDQDDLSASIITSAPLCIGAQGGGTPFTGSVDEVAAYDVELTLGAILELYNTGNPIDLTKVSSAGDLVGYWRCGDGDLYPYIADRSSSGNDGTMTNMEATDIVNDSAFTLIPTGTALLPRVSGYSVVFGGTDEYVKVGNVLAFERTDPFSITGWFKTTNLNSQYVVSKIGATDRGYLVAVDSTGLWFGLQNSGANRILVYTETPLNDGKWHAFAACYDGSSSAAGVLVYVDGLLQATSIITDALTATVVDTVELRVGARANDTSWWVGNVDNIAIYNVELSVDDVTRIYNGGDPCDLTKLNTWVNLVGWWKMGDGDTFPVLEDSSRTKATYPTLLDSSGSGHHGLATNMEAVDVVRDTSGTSADKMCVFGGTNEFVTMGTGVHGFEYDEPFSVSSWVRTTSSNDQTLLSKCTSSTIRGWLFQVYGGAGGVMLFQMLNSTAPLYEVSRRSASSVNDGLWHHVVATSDGTGTAAGLHVYIDGVLDDGTTGDTLGDRTIVNAAAFNLGARNSAVAFLIGDLDEVAVYDKELTLAEVLDIYNSGVPNSLDQLRSVSALVGWWRMGDGDSYPTLTDHGSGGNDGTMTNMESGDIQTSPLSGKFSLRSYDFGGTDESVTMGDVSALNFERTDSFSVSVWFKTSTVAWQALVGKQLGSPSYQGWSIMMEGGGAAGTLRLDVANYTVTNHLSVRNTVSLADGVWHHFLVTYDGSSTPGGVALYVDGAAVSMVTGDNTLSSTIQSAAEASVGSGNGSYNFFTGLIDEAAVYSKELSVDDVSDLYSGGVPPDILTLSSVSDLEAYWRMGDPVPFRGTMVNMEAADIEKEVPLAGGTIQFVQGTERDIGQVATVTGSQAVTLKDAKGLGANAWQWEVLSAPGPLAAFPTITDDEAQQATVTPVTDGIYVIKVTRTAFDGDESTDMQALMVLDSEGYSLPSAGVDGLMNSSGEAVVASWVGRADAGTNVLFDAYVRWLKDSLRNAQTFQIVAGSQQKDTTAFEGIGVIRLDASNFPTHATTVFQAVLEATLGYTSEVHLYNLTDGYVVAGSLVSTTATSSTTVEGTITLPSGQKDYEVRLRVTAGGGGFATCTGARIILE